jgi:hypothetical protein
MQLNIPVRVAAEDTFFVVDKAGVDMRVTKSSDGWEVLIDMIEQGFRVVVGMCGKQKHITRSSKLFTVQPVFELFCARVVGCAATVTFNTKHALEASIKLVPEYATVWAATATSNTVFLVTEHPRGGWICDSCGDEYELLKTLCEHLRAPFCTKFRRVSKTGIIDGICPPPSLTTRKTPANQRYNWAINPDALRKKLKATKTIKVKPLIEKLTLKPRYG